MPKELSKAELRKLKSAAHHLNPVLSIGDAGLSDAVYKEAETAIAHHELIKVKLPAIERNDRRSLIATLCEKLDALLVQSIGRTATIYREKPDQP